jgi:hypothetical protein
MQTEATSVWRLQTQDLDSLDLQRLQSSRKTVKSALDQLQELLPAAV